MSGFLWDAQTHDLGLDNLHHVLVIEHLTEKCAATVIPSDTGAGGLHYLNLAELSVADCTVGYIYEYIIVERRNLGGVNLACLGVELLDECLVVDDADCRADGLLDICLDFGIGNCLAKSELLGGIGNVGAVGKHITDTEVVKFDDCPPSLLGTLPMSGAGCVTLLGVRLHVMNDFDGKDAISDRGVLSDPKGLFFLSMTSFPKFDTIWLR